MGIAQQMTALSNQMEELRKSYSLLTGKSGEGLSIGQISDELGSFITSMPIDNLTWSQIDSISKAYRSGAISLEELSVFVGQEKKVHDFPNTCDRSGIIKFTVIGVGHDELSDGSGKAAFTFALSMSGSNFDKTMAIGTQSYVQSLGWNDLANKSYFEPGGYFYDSLESGLISVVKEVNKKCLKQVDRTTRTVETIPMTIWPISKSEIEASVLSAYDDGSSVYDYWSKKQTESARQFVPELVAEKWSTRTLSNAGTSSNVYVIGYSASGGDNMIQPNETSYYLPCFCV